MTEWQDPTLGSLAPLARELVPEFEKTILQLVVDGFQRWQAEGFHRFGEYEDHYTVRLYRCMKQIQRERNLALLPLYQDVEPSDAMLEGLEDPAHAPRIDITVAWDFLTDDAYFSIECKRVAPDDLARLYVICGINRFVRGYYGAAVQSGGMVGYVISGTSDEVLQRVNTHVVGASNMGSTHILAHTDPVGWLVDVFASNHVRSSPFPTIRLTHLLFDMTDLPPMSTASG